MLKFLEGQRNKAQKELEELMEQRRNAGSEAIGGIQNRIDNVKLELNRLNDEIKIEETKNTSIQSIYFFVIVSTKEKVKTNLGECCQHLNDARYHSTDCTQWKPFNRKEETIQVILEDIKEGYPIDIKYLDGELDDKIWIEIDHYIDKSIAIVDLLSLDETNKVIAQKFDNRQSKLLLPLCKRINNEILDVAEEFIHNFKTLSAYSKNKIDCMFFSDISTYNGFKDHIMRILAIYFPITNQSNTPNPLRAILSNNSFQ